MGNQWNLLVHPAAADELLELPDRDYRRVERALHGLEEDPFRSRAGVDVVKLRDLEEGSALYRLRVGKRRVLYAVIRADRTVYVLLVEDRELGYARLMEIARRRLPE